MTIVQDGAVNTTSLQVPQLLVQIKPPHNYLINGVPTNVVGIVGTATWGPVNSPTIASGPADATLQFGALQARKYDLGTAVAAAAFQGANQFRLVRVTDGTDAAATATITCGSAGLATAIANAINQGNSALRGPSQLVVASTSTTTLTLTAKYTGTLGNSLKALIGPGSAATTTKLVITLPGQLPETFDNLGAASTTAATSTFASGTDGATTITAAVLIGQDTLPRKGMYALRGTGASVGVLADADDSTSWTAQVAYGLAEGTYMILTGPAGDSISNAVSTKATAGIDSYAAKMMFGDWVLINDTVNNQIRLVSPQGFIAGKLGALSPEQSTLNKQMFGIVGTQKSSANQNYSEAELQVLAQAGIDVITNPVPGGNYYGGRIGRNTSSNAVINGDNYTRMINYLSSTLNAGMGIFIGQLQKPKVRLQAKATIDNFLLALQSQDMIGNAEGTPPFSTVLDITNNPPNRVALGYMVADVKVQLYSVIFYFIINLEAGQSVQVTLDRIEQV